jgi:RNA polymerase sigma-70 factor, ECF subfamily
VGVVERCKRGDEQAWRELVEATHKEVYTLCLRILGDPQDAAEAVQDTYLRVWRGLSRFRGEAQFTTWLYRVATNTAISSYRARKRKRTREMEARDEVLGQIAAPGSTEAAAGARIDLQVLERALMGLPDLYRLPVLLRDVYGLGIQEIAEQLKISESATKVRVHRGRKRLRDAMFAEEEGSSRG